MSMFRRRIILSRENPKQPASGSGCMRAALEDDFHHFCVELHYQDGIVTALHGTAPRHPYSTCPQALEPLQALVGMALTPVAHAVTRVTPGELQCTHWFELAGLAIAAAARGTARRQYDVEVDTLAEVAVDGVRHARIHRDGAPLLAWRVRDGTILGPPPYENIALMQGMARWALDTLPVEEAEAALVLRRCTGISKGRSINLDAQVHAKPNAHCYSQQPVRAEQALRQIGSTWDFAHRPQALCRDDLDWLDFKLPVV